MSKRAGRPIGKAENCWKLQPKRRLNNPEALINFDFRDLEYWRTGVMVNRWISFCNTPILHQSRNQWWIDRSAECNTELALSIARSCRYPGWFGIATFAVAYIFESQASRTCLTYCPQSLILNKNIIPINLKGGIHGRKDSFRMCELRQQNRAKCWGFDYSGVLRQTHAGWGIGCLWGEHHGRTLTVG